MASSSSSSSSPRTWRYRVFASFHGTDVRQSFVSHIRTQFKVKGITMFDDRHIQRGETIAPALKRAIKESKISVVILSKNYASSSWCLDELLEILKCKEVMGQIVMTIFYGVDPSDVRKQTGDFGNVFKEICARKTLEESRRWSQALNDVGNIAGEHVVNWDGESEMIEKIIRDISQRGNTMPSRDFQDMVGLQTHLSKMESLLDLEYDGVMMVGISGPAGIGKSTIARALHTQLSSSLHLTCFMENLRENYNSGLDEYGWKLRLQEHLLSKILNQDKTRIGHLGAIKERLCDVKVLIILDDVNCVKQLEALVDEITWFGPGSRIIVTTENKELLRQHGINNTYHVGFPSHEEANEILCRYAFKQSSPYHGFQKLAREVTQLCANLPLGLRVVGSSLHGKNEDEWEYAIRSLESIINRDIEEVLAVGYESLGENEQALFLHIAIFFNYKEGDLVKTMFDDNNLDIKHGLKILVDRSLIEIPMYGERIEMHQLLQQVGRQAIRRQEPWKRQILFEAQEICYVLENDKGTGAVSGISFDTSGINEVTISTKSLRTMCNLRFLSIYKTRRDGNDKVHIPKDMERPPRLRLLHWEAYPSKFLPIRFCPQNLVELNMKNSHLEKLWKETQPLPNLKKMDLSSSYHLKELPDLSNAINLETLYLSHCKSLVVIPSSFSHLQKLKTLSMNNCINLQVIPDHLNLESLETVWLDGCSKLRNIPVMSTNIKTMFVSKTAAEDAPSSIMLCHRLHHLDLSYNGNLKGLLTHLPTSISSLDLSNSDIEKIPNWIKSLYSLEKIDLSGCRKLASLPELPYRLIRLTAEDCESLERVYGPINMKHGELNFTNCFKLSEVARRIITQRVSFDALACLPGSLIPSEFIHKARGNSLTIRPSSASSSFKACVVITPNQQRRIGRIYGSDLLQCRIMEKTGRCIYRHSFDIQRPDDSVGFSSEHLCILHGDIKGFNSEAMFEFLICSPLRLENYGIAECGVRILTYEDEISDSRSMERFDDSSEEFERQEWFKQFQKRMLEGEKDCWCRACSLYIAFGLTILVVVVVVFFYFIKFLVVFIWSRLHR